MEDIIVVNHFLTKALSRHTAVCPPSSSKKPTHRPWVILHEPFRAKFDPPITQNLFYLRI
ncbi:hypothetical protein SFRURICE_009173 [Spodoptera frugiperda]|nr:hypothetical protein SFRURICE_009173 [Spodoptera frugiperda]